MYMKEKITITVDTELLKWMDDKIINFEFGSRSQAINYAISKLVKST